MKVISIFYLLLLFLAVVTSSCTKNGKSDPKIKAALLFVLNEMAKPKPITAEENTSTAVSNLPITTKEAEVSVPLTPGSAYVLVKKNTSISQRVTIKSTDPRKLNLVLPSDGQYLVQFFKIDNKTVSVSELDVQRKTTIDLPKVTPTQASFNNLTSEYNTVSATETISVIPTEKIQSLSCNNKEYVDSQLKDGKASSFTIQVGIQFTLSCIVTDYAGNTKPLDSITIRKVSSSPWLESTLPNPFLVSNTQVLESCYQSNLSEMTVTAGTKPLLVTINESGQTCVNLSVPYGSKTTEIKVEGKNISGNSYSYTHFVIQLKGIKEPSITLTSATTIKVVKNESLDGITTFVSIGNETIAFTESERVIDLAPMTPIGTSILSASNYRNGYSSIASTFTFYRKLVVQPSDVVSQVINDHTGNYLPTEFDFTVSGLKACTTSGLATSRPFLRAVFTSQTGFTDNVQLTLRARSFTNFNTRRQSGPLTGVFNTTYFLNVRLYNFNKKSYDEEVTVQGSEQIPVTLTISKDNINNKQFVILLESSENTKTATGDYFYTLRSYNECYPAWGGGSFSCPFGDGRSYSDQTGLACISRNATCNEHQWIETSSTIILPSDEIGFAVIE